MNKFLWIDCETTGLDPRDHTVHQVAGEVVIDGISVDQFNFQMVPHEGAEVEEKALSVSGLTIKEVMDRKVTSEEAYKQFNRILCNYVDKYDKSDKFVFAAYNANFDAEHINGWYNRNKNKYFFGLCHGGAYFDPLNLALLYEMKHGRRIFFPNRKLTVVAEYFGVPLHDAHDALADIKATRAVAKLLWKEIVK